MESVTVHISGRAAAVVRAYMEEYKERLKIIEQRRQEMMEKFRPKKQ